MIINVSDPISLKQFEKIHNSEPIMIWYHAEWCGHCQHMADDWEEFNKHCESKNMNTAKISDEMLSDLKYEHNVEGFPTIELHNKGKKVKDFNKQRNSTEFINFLEENLKELGLKTNKKKLSKKKQKRKKPSSLKKKKRKTNSRKRRKTV
jgi:thiol-disulfide isomerase/thioredoxin